MVMLVWGGVSVILKSAWCLQCAEEASVTHLGCLCDRRLCRLGLRPVFTASYSPISTVVQYCAAQIEDTGWGLSMGERVV